MLILAPMQGLTELMFRRVYHRCFPGAIDMAVSPFLSLTHGNLADACKKIDDVLPDDNSDSLPVIPQILGKEPEEFVALANRLHEVGYDEVNWNIGCPMRRVAAKHRGSGILPYPDEVRQLLDYVVPKLTLKLSVKMRLGLYSKDEIFDLVPILNQYPLASVTIHPRTGRQQYGGQVDLDTFAQVPPLSVHPVVYNGDICTLADYQRICQRFPSVKDVMIGRGVLFDALLPVRIKEQEGQCFSEVSTTSHFILSMLDAILARPVPEASKIRKIKEYWCLLRRSLPITEQQSMAVLHAETLSDTLDRIHALLDTHTHQSGQDTTEVRPLADLQKKSSPNNNN